MNMSLPECWSKVNPTFSQSLATTSKQLCANWQNLTLQLMPERTLYKRLYLVEPLWKLRLPLDGSKCHLFHLLIIHTPEAIPHGMVQPITAAMLERFQNLNKSSWPNHSYQSM